MTERTAAKASANAAAHAVIGAAAALVPAFLLRGFTVDDALIPARYAAHLAAGEGYRFNAAGPSTDGVTPLGWAHLLAPFAQEGPLAALYAAKWIGLVAWTLAAAALAVAVGRASDKPQRWAALAGARSVAQKVERRAASTGGGGGAGDFRQERMELSEIIRRSAALRA